LLRIAEYLVLRVDIQGNATESVPVDPAPIRVNPAAPRRGLGSQRPRARV